MALVLAIEPDLRQAEILTRIVREKVKADLVIVDSRDAAMEAMRTAVPDVMLLSALLSPRDEDELVGHLRTLEAAAHLQTHTIPQLASAGGDGPSGPARGLLRAFRRKKDTQPPVAGCDPDLFAQEIRMFLEQAEQRRQERAEELQYRPAITPRTAVAAESKALYEEPQAPPAMTSWDSPFEWRKSDTGPTPLPAAFAEAAAPAPPKFEPVQEPDEAEFNWSAHLLDPSSIGSTPVDAAPVPEPAVAPDHLLDAPQEPDAFEADNAAEQPVLVPEAASIAEERSPDATEIQAQQPTPEPVEALQPPPAEEPFELHDFTPALELADVEESLVQAVNAADASDSDEMPPQPSGADHVDPQEQLETPELFETFVPIPPTAEAEIALTETTSAAIESNESEAEYAAATADDEHAMPTPEEIEAYGRTVLPAAAPAIEPAASLEFAVADILQQLKAEDVEGAAASGTMSPSAPAGADDPFAIECLIDPEPLEVEPPAVPAAMNAAPVVHEIEEEIDLSQSVDALTVQAAEGLASPHDGEAAVASSEFADALLDDELEAIAVDQATPEHPPAPKPPVNLGPLATWARLERKGDDERRPGSDMREIIERLAVPPHIAGVSYARGVRIRRVRVAGTRDRRRPSDQTGPVILSRRVLAESRSSGASA